MANTAKLVLVSKEQALKWVGLFAIDASISSSERQWNWLIEPHMVASTFLTELLKRSGKSFRNWADRAACASAPTKGAVPCALYIELVMVALSFLVEAVQKAGSVEKVPSSVLILFFCRSFLIYVAPPLVMLWRDRGDLKASTQIDQALFQSARGAFQTLTNQNIQQARKQINQISLENIILIEQIQQFNQNPERSISWAVKANHFK